jgi:uncharacterized protein (DUF433 family)
MGSEHRNEVERLLGELNRGEICGGSATIVRTRIPVWTLEQARRLGTSEAEILRSYPSLRAGDLASAWAYVRGHCEESSARSSRTRRPELWVSEAAAGDPWGASYARR